MSGLLNGLAQVLGGLLGSLLPGGAQAAQVSDVLGQINQAVDYASTMGDNAASSGLQLIPAQSGNAFTSASSALVDAVAGTSSGFHLLLGQTYFGLASAFGLGGSSGAVVYLSGIDLSGPVGGWSAKLTSGGMYAGQDIASLALSLPSQVATATNPAMFMPQPGPSFA